LAELVEIFRSTDSHWTEATADPGERTQKRESAVSRAQLFEPSCSGNSGDFRPMLWSEIIAFSVLHVPSFPCPQRNDAGL